MIRKIMIPLLLLAICSTGSASIAPIAKSTIRKAAPLLNNATGAYSSSKPRISIETAQYPSYNNRNQSFQPISQQYAQPKSILTNQEPSISDSVSKYINKTKDFFEEIVDETEAFIQNEVGINIGYKTAEEKAFAEKAAPALHRLNNILKDGGIDMPYDEFIREVAKSTQSPDKVRRALTSYFHINFAMVNTKANPLKLVIIVGKDGNNIFKNLIDTVHELEQNIPSQTLNNGVTVVQEDFVILHKLSYCLNEIKKSMDKTKTIDERDDIIDNISRATPEYPSNQTIKIIPSLTVYNLQSAA